MSADKIKGIGGSPIQVIGDEKLNLTLKFDGGQVSQIHNLDAVLVPSSPYNFIPQQLLVSQIKDRGFFIDLFYHKKQNVFLSIVHLPNILKFFIIL